MCSVIQFFILDVHVCLPVCRDFLSGFWSGSGSGSVSSNVLQRMSRHTVVTLNSDGRTCNAEAVRKWTQTGTSAEKNNSCSIYTWRGDVTGVTADAAWTPPMTRPPLAPLGEHSRPGWFLERRRTCRHLQTAKTLKLLGMTSRAAGWCRGSGCYSWGCVYASHWLTYSNHLAW